MFHQQQVILESTPAIRELLSRYQWQTEPAHWLDNAEEKSRQFVVPLPLVGAFSACKSSLINALISSPIFPPSLTRKPPSRLKCAMAKQKLDAK